VTADGPGDDLDALLSRIGDPRGWRFVIDFDGTLAPIVDRPEDAAPAPGALEAVTALSGSCDVALLSGRALDDLVARLGRVPDRVLLVGGHGNEARHPDGTREALTDLEAARGPLDDLEAALGDLLDQEAGWQVERKPTSVAVHHRRVEDQAVDAQLPRVRSLLEDATDREPGFVLLEGKAVVEPKVRGVDKGVALRWLAALADGRGPEGSKAVPLVLGDDTTDEDAFAVAVACGGEAVRIAEAPTATSARYRLRDPSRVVTLLRAVNDRLGDDATPAPPWGSRTG
jgi:trehalose 6-phosphate phosphatase